MDRGVGDIGITYHILHQGRLSLPARSDSAAGCCTGSPMERIAAGGGRRLSDEDLRLAVPNSFLPPGGRETLGVKSDRGTPLMIRVHTGVLALAGEKPHDARGATGIPMKIAGGPFHMKIREVCHPPPPGARFRNLLLSHALAAIMVACHFAGLKPLYCIISIRCCLTLILRLDHPDHQLPGIWSSSRSNTVDGVSAAIVWRTIIPPLPSRGSRRHEREDPRPSARGSSRLI